MQQSRAFGSGERPRSLIGVEGAGVRLSSQNSDRSVQTLSARGRGREERCDEMGSEMKTGQLGDDWPIDTTGLLTGGAGEGRWRVLLEGDGYTAAMPITDELEMMSDWGEACDDEPESW